MKIHLLPSTKTGVTDCRCLRNYENTNNNANILYQKYPAISSITGNEDLEVSVAQLQISACITGIRIWPAAVKLHKAILEDFFARRNTVPIKCFLYVHHCKVEYFSEGKF